MAVRAAVFQRYGLAAGGVEGGDLGLCGFGGLRHIGRISGGGFEFQLSRTAVVGLAAAYRPFLFRGWADRANQRLSLIHI